MPKYTEYNYPKELIEWFELERDEKTLFFTGPSGTGKTEGLINLLKKNVLKLTVSAGFIGPCYAACAVILEAGDHFLGSVCYAGCTLWTGAIFYKGF
ncbi:MAG: hypothetical protein EOO99_11340 [Pedobacter sp.]|nr:MAG: hypothetical protein EOO99_11340 [Pedobacter sp.]